MVATAPFEDSKNYARFALSLMAAALMKREQVGSIVIVDANDAVTGIITDRDIALSLALGAATPDSFVVEVMSKDVKTTHESLTLFDVTRLFRTAKVKRLSVVDSENRLQGMVPIDDLRIGHMV